MRAAASVSLLAGLNGGDLIIVRFSRAGRSTVAGPGLWSFSECEINGGEGRAGFRAAQRGRGEVQQPTRLGHPEQAAACALGCAVTASRIVPVVCIQGSARSRR